MRRAAALLLAAALLAVLAACGGAGSGGRDPQDASSEQVNPPQGELVISCPERFRAVLRDVSAAFEETCPGVSVRFTDVPREADIRLTEGFAPTDTAGCLDMTDWYETHRDLFVDGAQRGADGRVYGIPFALNGALFWTYSGPDAPFSLEQAVRQAPLAVCADARSLLWGAVLPLYVRECENAGIAPQFGPDAPDSPAFSAALARVRELLDTGVLLADGDTARQTWAAGGAPLLLDDLYTPLRMKSRTTGPGEWTPSCALLFPEGELPAVCLASECFYIEADSPAAETALRWLDELYGHIDLYGKKTDLVLPAAYRLPAQSGTMSVALKNIYTLLADPDLSLYFADLTWTEDQYAGLLDLLDGWLAGE